MPTYLVDGSNVARSDAWAEALRRARAELPHELAGAPDPDPRARLLDWIAAWRTRSGEDVVVVFDGEGAQGAGRRQWDHGYLVVGSGGEDGDAVVEAEAARLHGSGVRFRLVTNDHALANVAGASAEAVLSCELFVADLTRDPVDDRQLHADEFSRRDDVPTRLGDDLDDDLRDRLERMRRGLEP